MDGRKQVIQDGHELYKKAIRKQNELVARPTWDTNSKNSPDFEFCGRYGPSFKNEDFTSNGVIF